MTDVAQSPRSLGSSIAEVRIQMGLVRRSRHRVADPRRDRLLQCAHRHRRFRLLRRLMMLIGAVLRDRRMPSASRPGAASSGGCSAASLCGRRHRCLHQPAAGLGVLTLLLAVSLIAGGVLRIWVGYQGTAAARLGLDRRRRRHHALAGLVIAIGWPVNSLWMLGMFLAIDLIFQGWSFIAFGLALKSRRSEGRTRCRSSSDSGRTPASSALASASSRFICATSASSPSNFSSPRRKPKKDTAQRLAVEVAGEIEDEGLEQRRAVVVDGRAAAEARHAVVQRAVGAAEAHGIDAVPQRRSRPAAPCWRSESPACGRAACRRPPRPRPCSGSRAGRRPRPTSPSAEQRADAARRDDLGALVAEGVDQRHAEAVPLARRHQEGRAALAVLAEMEIEAGHGMADAEPLLQHRR